MKQRESVKQVMYLHTLFFSCFLVMTCPARGQVAKKQLTKDDYHLWSRLQAEQLSTKGNWVSYTLFYQDNQDTLFVKHTQKNKTYAVAGGTNGLFANEKWFVCKGKENQLTTINLINGSRIDYKDVSSFKLTEDGRYLIMLCQNTIKQKRMEIKDLEGSNGLILNDVSHFLCHGKLNAIAYTIAVKDKNKIGLIYLDNGMKNSIVDDNTTSAYLEPNWQDNGKGLAFYKGNHSLGFYRLDDKHYFEFDINKSEVFPKGYELLSSGLVKLTVQQDGKYVIFGMQQQSMVNDKSGVQVWNTADRYIYPLHKQTEGWQTNTKLGVWWPETDHFLQLTDTLLPKVMFTGDQRHAITYNPMAYEPQFNHSGPVDYFLTDLTTGRRKLLLEKQTPAISSTIVSPSGKFVAYFKDGHWCIYEFASGKYSNLTQELKVTFAIENFDMADEPGAYGLGGWTDDDAYLLLYDRYDVWKVAANGSSAIRLTKGREEQMCYRLVSRFEENITTSNFNGLDKGLFRLSRGLLFSVKSENKSGFYEWTEKEGIKPLVFKEKRISQFLKSDDNTTYVYVEEHYHEPPRLMVQTGHKTKVKLLFQSNPHHQKYEWGFSKKISYYNSKGQLLKAALFYPAGYDASQEYPMVVKIYEEQSSDYNQYFLPTDYNSIGFNISNLTTQGYFVLLPDISYEIGDVGKSATDCVLSAVKEVLANESVDSKRMGLIGHSFGGYETYFIVTQTSLFATAIAGSGASDIISNYLCVGWNIGKPNGWRYEYQQSRMGKSLFEDRKLYERNSPITFVQQVQTPLLSWSGEEDRQVHYFQGIEFHLALRRLQKPSTMLLYEGDRHVIQNPKHQTDLTHRVEEWFGYYLKGGPKQAWMNPQN